MKCSLKTHASRHRVNDSRLREPMILCVDDDPDIAMAIEMRLRPYSVTVELAFYGMQGIWEALRKRPDLIIMDLAMPNGDGHYILECLRTNDETSMIPTIVLTGLRDPNLRRQVLRAGADVFLRKPIDFDKLFHNMSRFVTLHPKDAER